MGSQDQAFEPLLLIAASYFLQPWKR